MSDEQLSSKQRRRAEKRRREKEAKTTGVSLPSSTSSSTDTTTSSILPVVGKPAKTHSTGKWNFAVDYNDHFETPLVAYQDIVPLFRRLVSALKKDPSDIIIYDPYFCAGGMLGLLEQVGFPNVINRNRDFYLDVAKKQIPVHDILVTNPPYSGEHKPKLLDYLLSTIGNKSTTCSLPPKPFALLLPIYTATKNYWKEFASEFIRRTSDSDSLFYLVPPDCYEYQHPEGTGKDIPPFKSAWFIGIPPVGSGVGGGAGGVVDVMEVRRALQSASATTVGKAGGVRARGTCAVYSTVEQLAVAGHVVVDRRPNPKQRKKLMKMRAAGTAQTAAQPSGSDTGGDMPSQKKRRY